ncbi:MAG: hypothetical protein GW789_02970 [Ignavibacteria bacterium]|nr:hypothetical protein [Ignavibacteria bacterium]
MIVIFLISKAQYSGDGSVSGRITPLSVSTKSVNGKSIEVSCFIILMLFFLSS